ncbi:MAG TPA: hypothetical protein VMY05_02025 [Acidobacteriota bacterium]|nr:hypothetical protein [Acidobacteriota bacterium]
MYGRLFVPDVFWKVLAVTLGLAVIGLAIAFLVSSSVPLRDVVGTLISATMLAYMAHLWITPGD